MNGNDLKAICPGCGYTGGTRMEEMVLKRRASDHYQALHAEWRQRIAEGYLWKTWVSSNSRYSRSEHVAADGQRKLIMDSFEVGGEKLLLPGDPRASPDNTYNCRCTVRYDREGEEGDDCRRWAIDLSQALQATDRLYKEISYNLAEFHRKIDWAINERSPLYDLALAQAAAGILVATVDLRTGLDDRANPAGVLRYVSMILKKISPLLEVINATVESTDRYRKRLGEINVDAHLAGAKAAIGNVLLIRVATEEIQRETKLIVERTQQMVEARCIARPNDILNSNDKY